MSILIKNFSEDIFKSKSEVIINPVNCVGVMGRGLALAFKLKFPENFTTYKKSCDKSEINPGEILVVPVINVSFKYILNLATKNHWRDNSQLDWISNGVKSTRIWAEKNNINSVACPAIGCGLGELDWNKVLSILQDELSQSNVLFEVFEPHEPENKYSVKKLNSRI